MNASVPKKAPDRHMRTLITVGSPRRNRSAPAGSSLGSPPASRASPAAATGRTDQPTRSMA